MNGIDIRSEYYPYLKVFEGFYDLEEASIIPRKIMDYLLDMPDAQYTPIDDNKYSRVRFWKNLYYDEELPETYALPTPEQKLSVLFNPDFPTKPPTEKGYRLIPQKYIKPAQTDGQTRVYVSMGRTIATSDIRLQLSVVFHIWTNYTLESNTKASESYSRVDRIEKALIGALHGVNMAGVGTFYFNRSRHPDCGSDVLFDKDSNVGRRLILGLEVASQTPNGALPFNAAPLGTGSLW